MIGTHQMVRCGLGCGIRTVRSVRRCFRKWRIIRAKRSVHLVGGNMNETKVRISPGAESSPIRADLLQQRECAIDVSPYEILWPPDGAVHVTLGRKVYDGARLAAIEQTAQQPVVRDI